MSRLLPRAEATARFPDVQLNRTRLTLRSTRPQRLLRHGTQIPAIGYCTTDQTTVPNAFWRDAHRLMSVVVQVFGHGPMSDFSPLLALKGQWRVMLIHCGAEWIRSGESVAPNQHGR